MTDAIEYTATPVGYLATWPKYGAYEGRGASEDEARADLMTTLSALSPVYLDDMRTMGQGE